MTLRYLTSWDAADFTVLSGPNPFSDYNDANSSAIGSIFTVGQAELLTIDDGPADGGSTTFNESDDDQVFVSSSDPGGRNAASGTEIDPEYTYRIRPVGGASDGSQDIFVTAFEMGVGPGADGIVANAWLKPGQPYEVMAIASEGPGLSYASLYVCFAADTRLCTATGMRRIDALSRGDLLWTADDGFAPVRWLGSRHVPAARLAADPAGLPVRIAAGAVAHGVPARDVVVSQQHRIAVRSPIVARMFGVSEVLVAARHLLGIPGIALEASGRGVTWMHVLLDRHQVVEAEGMMTETLLPGTEALKTLPAAERAEVAGLFPPVDRQGDRTPGAPARPCVGGHRAARLRDRHLANRKPLWDPAFDAAAGTPGRVVPARRSRREALS